jgi:UDP-N-acetylmuramoyl-tripeptide--D-alanyl-D-alanine ligase
MKGKKRIQSLYTIFLEHPFVSTDSRDIHPGSVFFALRGARFDGNRFVAEALAKGASYAVVDDPAVSGPRCILVHDSLSCLQELASLHRSSFPIPLIAVTGTNGKTTTKELVSAVLQKKYNVISTAGNLNNHIGVPLTLLRIKKETQMAVVEMGANHPGEIAWLCRIARPTHGLITNIGKAHLEGFGSYKAVIKAKNELYRYLNRHKGTIFRNGDDTVLESLNFARKRIERYGLSGKYRFSGRVMRLDPFLAMEWSEQPASQPVKLHTLQTRMAGGYNIYNVLAAICIGRTFSVCPEEICHAIENYEPSNLRSQVIDSGTNRWLLDTYNANPSSMMAALQDFITYEHPYKIAILGDMLEMGKEEDAEHRKIIAFLMDSHIHDVMLVGPIFQRNNHAFPSFHDTGELIEWLRSHPPQSSLILVKGSRLMMLEKIMEGLSM